MKAVLTIQSQVPISHAGNSVASPPLGALLAHRLGGRTPQAALEAAAGATYDGIAGTRRRRHLAAIKTKASLSDSDTRPTARRVDG